jgi:hypothetical protein
MKFKPGLWYPIAVALSAINLVAAGFAIQPGEPWHVATHVALALGFGWWARRLRTGAGGSGLEGRLDAMEVEVRKVRQELSETQERLDFAERLLAQGAEARRVSAPR